MKQPPFRLYPEEQHWWSMADYGAVLEVTERLQAKTVLEFGPGWSTRALIEGGATTIDACEDDPVWFATHAERLVSAFPAIVRLHPYTIGDPITVPSIGNRTYDLALIDGPLGTEQRPAVIAFALARCAAVLVPTEEHAYSNGTIRAAIIRLAAECGREVAWMETGPGSGSFALMTIPNADPHVEHQDPQPENAEADLDVTPREPGYPASNLQFPPPPRRTRRSRRKGGAV
jgi:hypothetical protein